jgi:diguanylate cyclase (GGDEF)-like protein
MLACGRHECKIAVFFLDLDHFKAINDSLGHAVGDLLLQAVAERLESGIRQSDTIARTGGDEFVIITMGLHDEMNASLVATTILRCLDEPFWISGREIFINGSLGISIYPDDAGDASTLLKNADMAMYVAKEEGRNRYNYYAKQLQERAVERLEIETALRHAVADNLLSLVYQPQLDARTGTVIGLEALLRWNNPDGTPYLSPLQIITIAEKNGLIIPIGEWVLHTACRQLRQWQHEGLATPRLAINLSAVQFEEPGLVQMVQDVLQKNDLSPDYIELELTESAIMHRPDEAKQKLHELKKLGVWLALDDFGTGYSSLSYLKLFPIDRIKIDRSFVNEATTNNDDAAIVETVISLANNMRMQVIAEGVETQKHVEFLLARGCHEMQGYYYARPLSADQCRKLLVPGFVTEKWHGTLSMPS